MATQSLQRASSTPPAASDQTEATAAPARSNAAQQDKVSELKGGDAGLGDKINITPALLALLAGGSAKADSSTAGDTSTAKEPSIPKDHSYGYETFKGPAYAKGAGDADEVDANDVDQGALGDCYLHAAFAAIARANPAAIKKLIKDNGDGTYDVTLHIDVDGDYKPWAVDHVERVTASFPVSSPGAPAYAGNSKSADNGELWVMLLEKAYAQAKGGYDKIVSGNAGDAMDELGWGGHSSFKPSSLSDADVASRIDAALTNHKPITAGTPDFAKGDKQVAEDADKAGVHGDHAYAIEKVDTKALTVDVQNPWGPNTGARGLSIKDFKRFYTHVEIGN